MKRLFEATRAAFHDPRARSYQVVASVVWALILVSVGLCPEGADFGGPDDDPVKLFFTVISPEKDPAAHLQSLALISRWIKGNRKVEELVGLSDPEDILAHLRDFGDPPDGESA